MSSLSRLLYVAATALSGGSLCVLAMPAQAQTTDAIPAKAEPDANGKSKQTAVKLDGTRLDKGVEIITVTGRRSIASGLMKIQTAPEATQSITADVISKKAGLASPMALIGTLPGVNYNSSNAYGLAVRNFFTVRGLEMGEMGYVLEGMPANDQYSNIHYIDNWADNENIVDLTLIPGTNRLHDPVTTASGGELIMTIGDPSDQAGGMLDVGGGSFRARRAFARLDAGLLGASGVKMFGSFSYTQADNFAIKGTSRRYHADFKAVKDWGNSGTSKFFLSYNDLYDARTNPYTLAQFNADKAAGDFSIGNFAPTYTPGVSTSYYKVSGYRRETIYSSLQNEIPLSDRLSMHITPYFRWVDQYGGALSPQDPNSLFAGNQKVTVNPADIQIMPNGRFGAILTQPTTAYSGGVNSVLQYDLTKSNTIRLGYWYDHYYVHNSLVLNPVDLQGNLNRTSLYATNGILISGTNVKVRQDVHSINIADTQLLLDGRLQINLGFKQLFTRVNGVNDVPGASPRFHASVSKPLPRASILFKPQENIQIYADATTNTRPPLPAVAYPTTFNVATGGISSSGNTALPPEYSFGQEIGFRYYGPVNIDVALFHMRLNNRQVATAQVVSGLLLAQLINAGDEDIKGFTAEVSVPRFHGFAPYANLQYLSTHLLDNLSTRGTFLPTKGNEMPISPKLIASAGLSFESGGFFATATVKYNGSQYSTFMNDQKLAAYTVIDANIGYRFRSLGALQEPEIRLSMTNLNKGTYLGQVASIQTNARPTVALNGATIPAGTPSYYLSAPFSAVATFSIKF